MDPADEPAPAPRATSSAGALVALVLLGLLWLPVVIEAAGSYGENWAYTQPVDAREGFAGVLSHQKRNRMINLVIGLAARDLGGEDFGTLVLPTDYRKLSSLPPDSFGTRQVGAMQRYLLKRVLRRHLEWVDYKPALPTKEFDALIASPGVKAWSMDVFTVRVAGADHRRLVAVTDAKRRRIALVPAKGTVSVLDVKPKKPARGKKSGKRREPKAGEPAGAASKPVPAEASPPPADARPSPTPTGGR